MRIKQSINDFMEVAGYVAADKYEALYQENKQLLWDLKRAKQKNESLKKMVIESKPKKTKK